MMDQGRVVEEGPPGADLRRARDRAGARLRGQDPAALRRPLLLCRAPARPGHLPGGARLGGGSSPAGRSPAQGGDDRESADQKYRSARNGVMSWSGSRPRTSSAVSFAAIGPAVKPIQGNMVEEEAGHARHLAQDRLPVRRAVDDRGPGAQQPHAADRRHDTLGDAQVGGAASAGPSTGRPLAGSRRAGQPPPIRRAPSRASASGSASRRRSRAGAGRGAPPASVTLTWIGCPSIGRSSPTMRRPRPASAPAQLTTRRARIAAAPVAASEAVALALAARAAPCGAASSPRAAGPRGRRRAWRGAGWPCPRPGRRRRRSSPRRRRVRAARSSARPSISIGSPAARSIAALRSISRIWASVSATRSPPPERDLEVRAELRASRPTRGGSNSTISGMVGAKFARPGLALQPEGLVRDLGVDAAGVAARGLRVEVVALEQRDLDALAGEVVGRGAAGEPAADRPARRSASAVPKGLLPADGGPACAMITSARETQSRG